MQIINTYYSPEEIEKILEANIMSKINIHQEKLLEISDKLYIFNEISKNDILMITNNVNFKKYQKGDVIIKESDKEEDIFFILSGKVAVVVGNKNVVSTIDSGSMFGEMAFLMKKARTATIIAYHDNTVIISFRINTDKLSQIFSYPFAKLYQNIALDLSKKLEISNTKITSITK